MIAVSMRQYMSAMSWPQVHLFRRQGRRRQDGDGGRGGVVDRPTGRHTLLASTNPVHSLSSLLDQDVFGEPTAVSGVANLHAYEIDTRDTIAKSKVELTQKIEWFLKYADIKTRADEFVESATMNPAFEESAMFENMVDLMFQNKYDAYVFDTAPTANTRRLLGMSGVYAMWVNKMVHSREEARVACGTCSPTAAGRRRSGIL